jgi:hypothetical protein
MKRWAHKYSIAVFWAENMFFILQRFINELYLVPYNFLRVQFYVIKLAGLNDGYLIFLGAICGLPYLLLIVVPTDMYYYIKILADY